MKLMFARGWLPALVAYSDELPRYVGGMAQTFIVIIHPKYQDDKGIHAHELEHVVQWYATAAVMLILAFTANFQGQPGIGLGLALASIGLDGVLYRHSRRFRLWAEAGAYARQMQFPDRRGEYMTLAEASARLCSPRYNLQVTSSEACAYLTGQAS